MLRKLVLICTCLFSIPALCESAGSAKYQVATIVAVNPHSPDTGTDSSATSYDLSVQIGNEVYVVLYTPHLALQTIKYAAGRQILVTVGEKTLTFNDISGNAVETQILTHQTAAASRIR